MKRVRTLVFLSKLTVIRIWMEIELRKRIVVIGAALLAIGLIAGWALSHLDAVTLFFSGSRTFDEEIETLHASSAVRWLVLGAVLAFVVSSVVLLVTFDSYQSQANERKSDARELRIKREQLERERQQPPVERVARSVAPS